MIQYFSLIGALYVEIAMGVIGSYDSETVSYDSRQTPCGVTSCKRPTPVNSYFGWSRTEGPTVVIKPMFPRALSAPGIINVCLGPQEPLRTW